MTSEYLSKLFSLEGKVAIVTGGTGVLGGAMVRGLAAAGAKVGVLGRRRAEAEAVAGEIIAAGGAALALPADVLDQAQLEQARQNVLGSWGHIDILVNAAGGNVGAANVGPDQRFFDVQINALRQVVDLNWFGTVLPSQVFAAVMADQKQGCIVNISSMAVTRALTRVIGYGAAKAGVENLTHWLAVELAQKYGDGLRVNAIAPGFFIGEQNRRLLLDENDNLTPRGQTIINNTPARRFGQPDELIATLIWLCGPGASFVNGVVVPVDGGFSAFSGV
jgi:NAD(P)-dependent dehydrogenase (short-subunit alcohol dehydrogenase family)